MEVTVVGAGVAGLCAAVVLQERGYRVRVFDGAPGLGPRSCSWYAGGMLAPWCEGETAPERVVRLGQTALDWWDARVTGVARRGSLVLAPGRDQGELARFARCTQRYETVDRAGIAALEPHLAERFDRGLFFPDEGHLEPRAALTDLRDRVIAGGGQLHYDMTVDLETLEGPVVDARGFAARDALPDLRGVKGEMVVLHCPEVAISRPVRLLHPRHPLYLVPRGEGLYMLGATQIESGERGRVTVRGQVDLLNAAYALHPAFAEAEIVETGADVRPAFPDNCPQVRRQGRRFFINGLFRHGFLMAPACARQLTDMMEGPRAETAAESRGRSEREDKGERTVA